MYIHYMYCTYNVHWRTKFDTQRPHHRGAVQDPNAPSGASTAAPHFIYRSNCIEEPI